MKVSFSNEEKKKLSYLNVFYDKINRLAKPTEKKCIKILEEITETFPSVPETEKLIYLVFSRIEKNKYSTYVKNEKIELALHEIIKKSNDIKIYSFFVRVLALAYLQLKNFKKGEQLYEIIKNKFVFSEEQEEKIRYNLAKHFNYLGKHQTAVELLENCNSELAKFELTESLTFLKKYDLVRKKYKKMLLENLSKKMRVLIYLRMADLEMVTGNKVKLKYYVKKLETNLLYTKDDEYIVQGCLEMYYFYSFLGEKIEAFSYLKKALRYNAIGTGDIDAQIKVIELLIKEFETNPEVLEKFYLKIKKYDIDNKLLSYFK